MKVNFDIVDNYALESQGRHLDFHNNFDFVQLNYIVVSKEISISWVKSKGNWVSETEVSGFDLIHRSVSFFSITSQNEENNANESAHLEEVTFYPSTERENNNNLSTNSTPSFGDDIVYFLGDGQVIRIHCDEIELKYQ